MILLIGLIKENKAEDVVFINKNSPAPFSGVLFSEQKAIQIRKDVLEADKTSLLLQFEKEQSNSLYQTIKLKETEIELFRQQNKRLVEQQTYSSTLNYVWFGLGVLATGIAVYGAGALAK